MLRLHELLMSAEGLSAWVYPPVLAAGLASALSPCYLPILALFAGYTGGYARGGGAGGLRLAVPFVAGNVVMLALVGGVAALVGRSVMTVFTGYQLDRWIPGVVGVVMGLQLLGVLRLRLPAPAVPKPERPGTGWGSFALGLPFGLVVTPCTVPIFFAVVALVAFQASPLNGALLMAAYAVGRGVVLLAVAASAALLKSFDMGAAARRAERLSGASIVAISMALLLFYDSWARYVGGAMAMSH